MKKRTTKGSPESGPSYEGIRKNCSLHNEHTTEIGSAIGPIICQFKNKRKSAQMDFDLEKTGLILIAERWRDMARAHQEYVVNAFSRGDWKTFEGHFSDVWICVDVLKEDAEEWFRMIYDRLERKEGLMGLSTARKAWLLP